MKKKFKDSKVGGWVLGQLIPGAAKSIPIVGDLVSNVMSPEGGQGNLDKKELPFLLARLALLGLLVYLAISGQITWEDAERGKEMLGD